MSVFDPRWPRASEWIGGDHHADASLSISLVGVPLNCSITPGHCDDMPEAFRATLSKFSTFDLHEAVDLRSLKVTDLGNATIDRSSPVRAVDPVVSLLQWGGAASAATVLIGGDNAVTRPGVLGIAKTKGLSLDRVGLLTLDAHLDLRHTADGLHNGNPVRALLQDGLPGNNIVQIGILPFANSKEYADIAQEHGIHVFSEAQARRSGVAELVVEQLNFLAAKCDAIYVDCDVDVLDRAFAPGCPGARPGGLTPPELFASVRACGQHPLVAALDIVEVDPSRDENARTVMAACSIFLNFCSGLLQRD